MAVWETVFFTVFNCLALVIGSCANFLVIASSLLFISDQDIEATSLFLVSLSVADFFLCTVYQPMMVFRFNHPGQNQFYKSSMSFLGYSLMTASLNGLLAVSFDRFVAIYLPFKYITWMSEKNVAYLISVSWLVALAMGVLEFISNVGRVVAHSYTTIIIVVVPILYGVIYRAARKQTRRIIEQTTPATNAIPNRPSLTDKATRGVGLVLLITLICWLPIIIVAPAFLGTTENDEERFRAFAWCLAASCVNSCISPFIYFYKFSKFRRNVRKLFQKIGCINPFSINRGTGRVNPTTQDHAYQMPESSRREAWTLDEATTVRL